MAHDFTRSQGRKMDVKANALERELTLKQNDLGVEVILL
jgi:hypothetical protein